MGHLKQVTRLKLYIQSGVKEARDFKHRSTISKLCWSYYRFIGDAYSLHDDRGQLPKRGTRDRVCRRVFSEVQPDENKWLSNKFKFLKILLLIKEIGVCQSS